MAKEVDVNGFWTVRHNPLSKVGVYDYLSQGVSDTIPANQMVKVYRSAETLRNAAAAWNNKPVILNHEMLGEGFSDVDSRPAQGVITNVEFDETDGVLYGDITIWSEELKDAIKGGTKDISLGYRCTYTKESGVFDGQVYTWTQTEMEPNHVAVVESGRCGHGVRVYDAKDAKCTMDSVDILGAEFTQEQPADGEMLKTNPDSDTIDNEETTINKGKETMADKREVIREIMAIAAKPNSDFEGGETEKIETIAKILEKSEYAKSESGKADDEEEKAEEKAADKCGKDEEESKEQEKKAEDSDTVSASEVMSFLKGIWERLDGVLTRVPEHAKDEEEKEEKKSEDEDEEKEEKEDDKKSTGDSVGFTFGTPAKGTVAEDAALKAYLAD